MRERKLFALLMLFALSSMILIPLNRVAASPGPTISVTPASTTGILPGATFSVTIDITNAVDMYAWGVRLGFNNLLLELTAADQGLFLKGGGISTYWTVVDKAAANLVGYADLGCTRLGEVPGKTGSGVAATITFLVKEVYTGTLDLYNGQWIDSALVTSAFDAEVDGTFDNTGLVGTWMGADLAGHSAWPEHHHFVASKDEDGYNTLMGKARSLGPTASVYLRVRFTDVPDILTPGDLLTDPTATTVAPGTALVLTANFGPLTSAEAGKYSITAKVEFSYGGVYWYQGTDLKAFSFAVVP